MLCISIKIIQKVIKTNKNKNQSVPLWVSVVLFGIHYMSYERKRASHFTMESEAGFHVHNIHTSVTTNSGDSHFVHSL
jgi:hypothetical protein